MATRTLTHKIRLDPTFKQETYFNKACGIARFAWNWGLAKWEEAYKTGKRPNALALKKEFNALKDKSFPWVYEVTKYACQQPFIYLQKAFNAFFEKRTKYPKFKRKGINDSFYIGGDQLKIINKKVKIPNLGWVRLREFLRFSGKINGAVISRSANYWYISISVETTQQPAPCESQASVGVDLGIKKLATLSDGKVILNNKPLKKQLYRLKRYQRRLSKKEKGSKNYKKAKSCLAKLHYKIACKRNDTLHKLTTMLTSSYQNIVIENLDISKMVKNKKFSRDILDGGWYEFKRQLFYKAELRGNKIFVADKFYASSKKCSCCGNYKKELSISERVYKCLNCSQEMDRDLNAAKCLEQLISTASFAGIEACGQEGSVIMLKTLLQPAWVNQELSHV
jgi:putative transposase